MYKLNSVKYIMITMTNLAKTKLTHLIKQNGKSATIFKEWWVLVFI